MKTQFLIKAGFAFIVLLALAYLFDSVRIVKNSWSQLEELDTTMRQFEERYIATAKTLGVSSPEFDSAVREYEGATSITARRDNFEKIVISGNRAAISLIDPANPVQRRTGDELAGALNRRRMNDDYFRSALDNYRGIKKGNRGSVASFIMTLPQE